MMTLKIGNSSLARILLVASIAVTTLAANGLAQSAGQVHGLRNRIAGPIVESDVVTLSGNTHPMARPENDRGTIAEETSLERMVLLLKPSAAQQRELDALTEAQQEPGSPEFRHWLSPEEYGSRFGVSSGDLARITGWLESHGFTVEPVPAGRSLILFSGSAGQVADTFHTEIHHYEIRGESHIANSQDPQIPQALAPVIAGVLSLHDFRRTSATRSVRAVASPENTQGSAHYLFPADFATIYDLNTLYAAGQNGKGISIAIVGRSNINLSDVSSFRSYAGLPANQPAVILDGKNPGMVAGDQDEATLDVEWAGGVAPAAAIEYVAAASTSTSDGVDLSAQYIVNHKTAAVMSTSFGNCEAHMGTGELAFYNRLWQQAASEGITALVSAGDSGAAGCDAASSSKGTVAAVNGLCSSPYSTCVGGTEFNEGGAASTYWGSTNHAGGASALSYMPEKVWNEGATNGGAELWASGGGVSGTYLQPVWQKGVPGASSNGLRAVPDVSLTAASHDGYLVCLKGNWYVFAGTSASSPSFAGIMSLVVQKQGGAAQGNANPLLYGLLSASANPFHATPSGDNSVTGVHGYTASGAAYNMATGLGSVDANLLVNEWPAATGGVTQKSFTIAPSSSAVAVQPGKPGTFTVMVTAAGGFTDSVALKATTPSGVTIVFNPASITPGVRSVATVMAAKGTALGTSAVILTGSSTAMTATSSVGVTVKMAATLSVTTKATKVSLIPGKSVTLAVTATAGGNYAGLASFAVSGLPAGVTATWTPATVTMNGVASKSSTLTLKAAANAALNTSSLKISATGDGVTSQTLCTLQVTSAAGLKLTVSSSQVSVKAGTQKQVTVTMTPQGNVTPATNLSGVNFQLTRLPRGVTATWSKPTLVAGTVKSTLTFVASKTAAASVNVLTVTGSMKDLSTAKLYTATGKIGLTVTR